MTTAFKFTAEIGAMGVGIFTWFADTTEYRLVWNFGGPWMFGAKDTGGVWAFRTAGLHEATTGRQAYAIAKEWIERGFALEKGEAERDA